MTAEADEDYKNTEKTKHANEDKNKIQFWRERISLCFIVL